jgi:hypothetical protein
MKTPKSSHRPRQGDRRSRIDRRWIKSRYQGEERRSGTDRRSEIEFRGLNRNLPAAGSSETRKIEGLERLTVRNTIQLEAITRLLLQKGILEEEELMTMMKTVQTEYNSDST